MMPADSDVAAVAITVLRVDRLSGYGRLLGFATAEIEIAGIAFELRGIRIIENRNREITVCPPVFRGRNGEWTESVGLPSEVKRPLGMLVGDAFRAMGGNIGNLTLTPVNGDCNQG
jgi:hypothetical protein